MALSFPASPSVGQQYTEGSKTWQWSGDTWDAVSSSDLSGGTLVLPTHGTPDTIEASIVWNPDTDEVTIGTGLDSTVLAKATDVPTALTDLSIVDGTTGQVLSTDGAGTFTFVDNTSSSSLATLSDVTTAGATNGQILTADGAGNFTFTTVTGVSSTLAGLSDVDVTGQTNGQVLTTDGAGNFTFTTINATPALDDLSDVTAAGSTAGQVLTSDGAGAYTFTTINATPALDDLSDVTAAGSTAGQVLTSDGAGAYTFTDNVHYTDADVATYLNGNLNTDIIPDTNSSYDIGAAGTNIAQIYADHIRAGNYTSVGQMIFNSGSDFIFGGSKINGTGANTLDLGENAFPLKAIYTNNLKVNTSLTVDGTVNSNIIPDGNNTRDLGDISNYWRDSYVNQMFTNRINVANFLTLPINSTPAVADGSITWDGNNDKLYVGNGVIAIEIGGIALTDLSITTATPGTAALAYDNSTGVFTYTPPVVPTVLTDLSIADGTNGQVLTTDGAGNFSFTTPSSSYSDTDVATYLNGNLDTHIIPDTNATYDIGAAEFKIRHLYLSDNSLKFVNASNTEYSMGVDGDGELTFQSVKLSDAAVAKVTSADLDMGGNRVLFANVYTNVGDLPDASAYHGMFAHVHSEAAAYYAHAGNWVALANKDEVTGASRNQYSGTSASIADQTSTNLDVTGCKTYTLMKITTDKAAWVTLYTDAASRTADTRTYADKGNDPSTSGVIAEVITTGAETVLIAPGVLGFNNESTPTTNIPMKVWNDSGSAGTVTVTVDVLTLEA